MNSRWAWSLVCHAAATFFMLLCPSAGGQERVIKIEDIFRRLDQQEERIHELASRLNNSNRVQRLPAPLSTGENVIQRLDALEEAVSHKVLNASLGQAGEVDRTHPYYSGYDGGFMIRPHDKSQFPFELKVNGRMQFRFTNFTTDHTSYTNLAGTANQQNRSEFEIERARLVFSGFMYDPNLHFFINIDGDTDDNHRAIFHDFWINYEFSDAFNVHCGKAFVPGTRAWLDGSTRTHLNARSMGSSFFRPDRSLGVWASGEVHEGVFYRAMISNGFITTDLKRSGLTGFEHDDHPFYSASMWWEPYGNFGQGYADLKYHVDPVVRFGHSFMYGSQAPQDSGAITLEERAIRLSDGSRITAVGVTEYNLFGYAVDFALKYRGWSFNTEYYFRWLKDIESGGSFTHSEIYQDGFYVDSGYMICHERLEIVGRVSQVDGIFKDSWEYAGGFNWYLNGTHKNKLSFDVGVFDGVPISTSGADLEIGMDGVLYRMQYQLAF